MNRRQARCRERQTTVAEEKRGTKRGRARDNDMVVDAVAYEKEATGRVLKQEDTSKAQTAHRKSKAIMPMQSLKNNVKACHRNLSMPLD